MHTWFRGCEAIGLLVASLLIFTNPSECAAQMSETAPGVDMRLYDIVESSSPARLESDIRKLVSFGTRNTMSDTVSQSRGIGAARRWIHSEFERISDESEGKLEVSYQYGLVKGQPNSRIKEDTWVVNVLAVQRGTTHPNREPWIMISHHHVRGIF